MHHICRKKFKLNIATIILMLTSGGLSIHGEFSDILRKLDPPDTTAKVFLPGIVSSPEMEYGLTVTQDWSEIYFNRETTIMMLTCSDEGINPPIAAPFSGHFIDGHPCLVPGDSMLVFVSRRPCAGAAEVLNPWIVKRTENGWSSPKSFGKPVIDQTIHAPSMSASGTLYASGLIRLRPSTTGYLPPEPLIPDIKGYTPAIAADESFIVFSAQREDSYGSKDLYVIFAKDNGRWSEPQNLGPGVNTEQYEGSPTLSVDGKYLFFSRHRDIWWVSIDVIEKLRNCE